ncbi:uncharacterized protein LOC123321920 isoform X1 [Coccinella septempunctata]|uniref:uncharacterized protein LOC123321920 isoform X1 n=1 Tax=Coccinella septempunctata TaxID=41139 RepID=UPI001D067076|nr:uncharacterized protein LOC123321920 isoform X1 [Coccinella septempunctata]
MSVKQERHDEAEIQELAAKMVEENKAKMATPQRTPNQPGTSMNILSYLNTNNAKSKSSTSIGNPSNSGDISDESSVRGRFGWISIAKSHIPYIIRGEELYCSVRMVEMKILNRYLTYLHPDIYNCTCIRSYFITEAECRLLNEINIKHCDCQFGREQFTTMDLIVRLTDAEEFFKFLSACYSKLLSGEVTALDRCGFIRINKESVVPYTIYQQQKYVPLFYFEGETDNLKQKADKLEGWDLSYLKFCCKVQGIRNELFAHDSCSVISLNDIKNYFPPGTLFEDYWPKKNMDSQLLISNSNRAPQQIIQWTRQPTHPPIQTKPSPSPKPATQAKAATNSQMHNMHLYSTYGITGGQPAYHPSQPRTASSAVRAYPAAAGARHMRPNYYNSMSQVPPPPLVRASQPQSSPYSNSQSNNTGNYIMLPQANSRVAGYHPGAPQMNKYPPPLVDVRHMNGGMTSREMQSSYVVTSSQNQMMNQQTTHQPTTRSESNISDDRNNVANGRMNMNNCTRKLQSIPDPPTGGSHVPYQMQKAVIENKMIPCINMKPFVFTDLLVTLPDLCSNFFNNVPVQSCQQVLQVLDVDLFKPNNSQMQVLMENGKCQNANETIPLVQVRSVIDFMPQLKYMLGGMLQSDMGSKRPRNS